MIVGMATLTIVVSMMIRETPRLITTGPHQRALDKGGRMRIGRESQPETAALRLLQTAMGDTEVALSRRLGMSHTPI
jgi:hypothetical protein